MDFIDYILASLAVILLTDSAEERSARTDAKLADLQAQLERVEMVCKEAAE